MKTYRAKPYATNPRIARLQCRVKWFFWRTLATGSTATMQRHAEDLEQRHAWKNHIAKNTVIRTHPKNP